MFPPPPRQPTHTLQAGMHKPASHVRHVFNSSTICYLKKKDNIILPTILRGLSSCPRCSGPQTLPGRFWRWVGACAWDQATQAVESILVSGHMGNVRKFQCRILAAVFLGGPIRISSHMHSPCQGQGLSGGHLRSVGPGLTWGLLPGGRPMY